MRMMTIERTVNHLKISTGSGNAFSKCIAVGDRVDGQILTAAQTEDGDLGGGDLLKVVVG